jgi:hypothetical protein
VELSSRMKAIKILLGSVVALAVVGVILCAQGLAGSEPSLGAPPVPRGTVEPATVAAVAPAPAEESLDAVDSRLAQLVRKTARNHRKVQVGFASEAAPATEPDAAMRMALRQNRSLLERCYENELKKRATFNGYLVVSLTLSEDGRVVRATIEQAGGSSAEVGACITARLKSLKLPKLTSDAELILPIRLEAKEPT